MEQEEFIRVGEAARIIGVNPHRLSQRIFANPNIGTNCLRDASGRRLIPVALLPELAARFNSTQLVEVSNGQN